MTQEQLVAFLQKRADDQVVEAIRHLQHLSSLSQGVAGELADPNETTSSLNWWTNHSQGLAYVAREAEQAMIQAKMYRGLILTIAPETG